MTLPLLNGDVLRHRVESELINALAGMPLMTQPDTRQLFMTRLRQRLDHQVQISDHPVPRYQAVAIVDRCLPMASSMTIVIDEVELLEPDLIWVAPLRRLHHEYEAIDILSPEDWSELRPLLRGIVPANRDRLCQRATELAGPPVWCETGWDLYLYLAGRNAPPDGLLPSMVLLLLLELEVDSDLASRLRRHNQRRASDLGLTEELDRRRAAIAAGQDLPLDPAVYLVVQIAPDHQAGTVVPGAERYTVSHYRQWHGGVTWHSQLYGQVRNVSYPDLPATVAAVVRQTEQQWRDLRGEVTVELVLPGELLNEDIPWWRVDEPTDLLPERVLAMDYPVVIRSLERLRRTGWHGKWDRRWELLQREPGRAELYRSQPDGGQDYLTRLEAELSSERHRAGLVLSEAPAGQDRIGRQEVMIALRAGLPVAIWHRTRATTDEFWEELQELAAGVLHRLPGRLRELRLAALRTPEAARANHLGRQVAILWDDPERPPELTSGDEGAAL